MVQSNTCGLRHAFVEPTHQWFRSVTFHIPVMPLFTVHHVYSHYHNYMHTPSRHMQRRSDQLPLSVDLSSAWNYESVSVFICVNYAESQLCEMVCSWCRSCSHQCQPQCVESIHCTSGLLPNPYSSRGASLINGIHDCWNVNYEHPIA